jgi:hypothetical protein
MGELEEGGYGRGGIYDETRECSLALMMRGLLRSAPR